MDETVYSVNGDIVNPGEVISGHIVCIDPDHISYSPYAVLTPPPMMSESMPPIEGDEPIMPGDGGERYHYELTVYGSAVDTTVWNWGTLSVESARGAGSAGRISGTKVMEEGNLILTNGGVAENTILDGMNFRMSVDNGAKAIGLSAQGRRI